MSIFDPTTFFSTPFVEDVQYYAGGVGVPVTIQAIITKHKRKPFTYQKVEPQQIYYPIEIMIKRSDVASITVKRDTVKITGNRGTLDTVTIQEVLSCDEGVWNLGAV